tara:strand:+ start:1196 stop:1405 length:210 start_codon:yes stop_codon:yes gene_type:complete
MISTHPLLVLFFPNRRGGIVSTYKNKSKNEKARRVFVLDRYFAPQSKNDHACHNNNFYIISFRIVDIKV